MDLDRKDSKYWKLGMFYFNPQDKETFVPKRTGFGVTMNFAKSIPLLVFIGAIVLLSVGIIISFIVKCI